jgi:hypothetical protein
MTFSKKEVLEVGDLVDHPADSNTGVPQGKGLITGIVKKNKSSSQNVWYVRFFNGMEFKIMEGYLKKIQGTVDIKD